MTQENIPERVIKVIANNLAISPDSVQPESRVKEDLGADSLDVVEFVMGLETEFSIEIPDEVVNQEMTIQQAIALVEGILNEQK